MNMGTTVTTVTTITFLALIATAQAEPMPYPKPHDGQCAGSYVQSGSFCVPKSGGSVRESIPKPRDGQCPQRMGVGGVVVRADALKLI